MLFLPFDFRLSTFLPASKAVRFSPRYRIALSMLYRRYALRPTLFALFDIRRSSFIIRRSSFLYTPPGPLSRGGSVGVEGSQEGEVFESLWFEGLKFEELGIRVESLGFRGKKDSWTLGLLDFWTFRLLTFDIRRSSFIVHRSVRRSTRGRNRLIKEPEEPERKAVFMSVFDIIHSQESIVNTFDLPEGFVPATHLKQIPAIHQKIPLTGIGDLMSGRKLVQKKCLPQTAFIRGRHTECIGQVRISGIYLLRLL